MVKLWYYAGDVSDPYRAGTKCDPLSDEWARIIAYMATARLERPLCACGNAAALSEWLREDLAVSQSKTGVRITPARVLDNPFGTRRGEVIAWTKIKHLIGIKLGVAVL